LHRGRLLPQGREDKKNPLSLWERVRVRESPLRGRARERVKRWNCADNNMPHP
jgi:hypothetical protein